MAQDFLKNPTVERLDGLLGQLKTGELQIPPFQREFVWSTEQRIHLLDSVAKGIPSGSLMLWRTKRTLPKRGPLGPFDIVRETESEDSLKTYLLDGQQRMTSLFATLGRALWTRAEQAPPEHIRTQTPDGASWELAYDLRQKSFVDPGPTPGDQATAHSPDGEAPLLLPLGCLLDDTAFDEWRDSVALDRGLIREARALQAAFRNYLVPTVPLVTEDMDIVQVTFKRANEGGTPMNDLHLARALTWTEDFDLTAQIEELRERLAPRGWATTPEDWVLKVLAGLTGNEPFAFDVEAVAKELRPAEGRAVSPIIKKAETGLNLAIDLHQKLGVCGPASLPYSYGLIFCAELLALHEAPLTAPAEQRVLAWLLVQWHTERLGQSPPHVLRALRSELKQLLSSPRKRKPRPKVVSPPTRFGFQWGRGKLSALALAAAADGESYPGAALLAAQGNDALHQLVHPSMRAGTAELRAGLGATDQIKAMMLRVENRVLIEAAELEDLRAALMANAEPEVRLLHRHHIPLDSVADLRAGRWVDFFKKRQRAIVEVQRAVLTANGIDTSILVLKND